MIYKRIRKMWKRAKSLSQKHQSEHQKEAFAWGETSKMKGNIKCPKQSDWK